MSIYPNAVSLAEALAPFDEQQAARYTSAAQSIKSMQNHEPPQLAASGRTQFMTHGYPVEQAVVLLHGYTNAPQQFAALGRKFFEEGCNVLIPRAPHHGLPDPLTEDHAQLTMEELQAAADRAVDVAQGLGQRVIVAGLSMGGLMTAWVAQRRADIDQALIISPAFGFQAVPRPLAQLVQAAALRLPNRMRWWDAQLKDTGPGPKHAYARYATRSLGQLLRFSHEIRAAARRSAPAARAVYVVTNANDESVDNRWTAELVQAWQANGARALYTYEFGVEQQLVHDLIDPQQPRQRVDYVYPILRKLLEE